MISSLWGRGQVYEQQGARALALADYKKAIELKAGNPDENVYQDKARARLAVLEAPAGEARKPQPIGRRVALAIGNSHYEIAPVLANPQNDARDIAAALKRLHFEAVLGLDLTVAQFDNAVDVFTAALITSPVQEV